MWGSANFNGTVISVFSFSKSEEATANFNTSNGDPWKKFKLSEYTNIEPVDNEVLVVPSAAQKVLASDALIIDENSRNGELPWMNKAWDVIRKDCNVDKFSAVWQPFVFFIDTTCSLYRDYEQYRDYYVFQLRV